MFGQADNIRLDHLCIYDNTTVIATIVLLKFTVNDDENCFQLQKKHCDLIVIGCIIVSAIHSNCITYHLLSAKC